MSTLSTGPQTDVRLWTPQEFQRMVAAGILTDPVELRGGVVIYTAPHPRAGSPRLWSRREYHALGDAELFDPRERVELIEGEVLRMSPIGRRHNSVVSRLVDFLVPQLHGRAIVWPQCSVGFPTSEPEPDIAILRWQEDFYEAERPGAADILVLMEVMQSSVSRDRRRKLPAYARAGVQEVWLISLPHDCVTSYRHPEGSTYREEQNHGLGAALAPMHLPELVVEVSAVLGR